MKTIVVTNRKGGVGKTTVATHLAAGLALRGWRTAIVDTDTQGQVALAFGMEKENGLYQIMTDEAQFADVLRNAPVERYAPANFQPPAGWFPLVVLPGAKGTAVIPTEQPSPFRFREVLDDMGEMLELDFIIVDTGPSSNMFDGSVNFAADYFLYVTQCAALSFDGLKEAMTEMEKINRSNSRYRTGETQVLGIVPNLARFGTKNHRENIAMLAEAFPKVIWNPITERTTWERAMDYGQTVYSYMPEGQEARDAWNIVQRVEQEVAYAKV